VLADPTRFGIYQFVSGRPGEPISVLDVAAEFGLHPNVARMHLGKLEQAGFLTSSQRKGPAGGRPAKLYSVAPGVRSLSFPPRRYDLLAELALEVVAAVAKESLVEELCRRAGQTEGRRYLGDVGGLPDDHGALAAAVRTIAEAQGLLPDVGWRDGALHVDVRNCVFREPAVRHPELACLMHHSYLRGLVESLAGGSTDPIQREGTSIGCGGDCCHLVCPLSHDAA
jgi:predicted ArsR family transcriptional regulator